MIVKKDSAGILYTNNLIRSGNPKRCVHTAKAGWLTDSYMVYSSEIKALLINKVLSLLTHSRPLAGLDRQDRYGFQPI